MLTCAGSGEPLKVCEQRSSRIRAGPGSWTAQSELMNQKRRGDHAGAAGQELPHESRKERRGLNCAKVMLLL